MNTHPKNWLWKIKTAAHIACTKRRGPECLGLILKGRLHDINVNKFYKGERFPSPETHLDLLLMASKNDFHESCQKYNYTPYIFDIHLKACQIRQDEDALKLLFKHTNIRANTFSNKDPQELAKLVFALPQEFQTPQLAHKLLDFLTVEEKNSTASPNKPGYLIQAAIQNNLSFVLWLWGKGEIKTRGECPYYEKLQSHLRNNQTPTARLIAQMMDHPSAHQKLLWTQKATQLQNMPHHVLWPQSP